MLDAKWKATERSDGSGYTIETDGHPYEIIAQCSMCYPEGSDGIDEDAAKHIVNLHNAAIAVHSEYIGTELYGFCDGFFGRDSYADKVIEGVGSDWIVARDENGRVSIATFNQTTTLEKMVEIWSTRPVSW